MDLEHTTVTETAKAVRHLRSVAPSNNIHQNNDRGREFLLREFLQAQVKIVREGRGGEIKIKFHDDNDLVRLLDRIRHS